MRLTRVACSVAHAKLVLLRYTIRGERWLKSVGGGESIEVSDWHRERQKEERSPLSPLGKKNVCLKKTFKCQKVQAIRLVRNESLSYLGECERNQSNSELMFIFLHDGTEQNQEVATQ